MRALPLIGVFAVAASGCATVLNEDSRTITVQSNVPGALVVLDGRPIGPAPRTLQVTNSRDHQIVVHAPGHAPQGCFLDATVGVGWVVLDVILIPLILPIVIDAITGEWRDLEQTDCFVTLMPVVAPGPPPVAPPPPS